MYRLDTSDRLEHQLDRATEEARHGQAVRRPRVRRPRPPARDPMHGYELRKRLNAMLGAFRAFSYGSLYPCLKRCWRPAWSTEAGRDGRRAARRQAVPDRLPAHGGGQGALRSSCSPRAARPPGRTRASASTSRSSAGPTPPTRLRILEGRRSRLEERLDGFRPRSPAAGSASTATPSSCTSTGWSPSSARSAGSPS